MLEAVKNSEIPVNRRKLLYFTGWGFIGIFAATITGSIIRFFFPRTIFEPPTRYSIGFPSQYASGVSEKI